MRRGPYLLVNFDWDDKSDDDCAGDSDDKTEVRMTFMTTLMNLSFTVWSPEHWYEVVSSHRLHVHLHASDYCGSSHPRGGYFYLVSVWLLSSRQT